MCEYYSKFDGRCMHPGNGPVSVDGNGWIRYVITPNSPTCAIVNPDTQSHVCNSTHTMIAEYEKKLSSFNF